MTPEPRPAPAPVLARPAGPAGPLSSLVVPRRPPSSAADDAPTRER
ncbi:hypothetical protein [Streptomyces sp. NPDC102283]